MTNLHIKLNFLHDAEMFINLRRLDKQWRLTTKSYELKEENKKSLSKKMRGNYFNTNWPTWNVEKKILRAMSMDYKFSNQLITSELLKDNDFLKKINPPLFLFENKKTFSPLHEIICSGPEYVMENLIVNGLANKKNDEGIIINKKGLEIGVFIARIYKFQEGEQGYKGEPIIKLVPKYRAKIGYNLLLFSAIAFLIYSLSYLTISLLSLVKLFDNFNFIINNIFQDNNYFLLIQDFITVILFLPILFFIVAILFIWPYNN